jgi:pyruvate decarboxylase
MIGEFLQENDIVVAETGTSSFGMISTALPKGATLISQVLWGSIGYAGGSTLGALMAAKESPVPRRVILFTGDGSIQLTVQDVATMLKNGLKPILVILNNDGCEFTFLK